MSIPVEMRIDLRLAGRPYREIGTFVESIPETNASLVPQLNDTIILHGDASLLGAPIEIRLTRIH